MDQRQGRMKSDLLLDRLASPLGDMQIVWERDGPIRAVDFLDYEDRMRRLLKRYCGDVAPSGGKIPSKTARAFDAYFAGRFSALDELAIATNGTAFQHSVWRVLKTIPPGNTASYGSVAVQLGKPKASRAVGRANGDNPIAIIIPCHRLVGSDGAITGYGGGVERKRWLLDHESCGRL